MISASVDLSQFDVDTKRLMSALNERNIHALASRTARRQVMLKYPGRFKEQVNSGSNWQKSKQEVQSDLPLGADPGSLTGTTFRSISSSADDMTGEVFLRGMWPKRSGNASSDKVMFEWGSDGLDYRLKSGFTGHTDSEDMSSIEYGKNGNLDWMYLDPQDIGQIRISIEKLMDAAVMGQSTKAVFAATTYSKDMA